MENKRMKRILELLIKGIGILLGIIPFIVGVVSLLLFGLFYLIYYLSNAMVDTFLYPYYYVKHLQETNEKLSYEDYRNNVNRDRGI